jgi:hypothetical protein
VAYTKSCMVGSAGTQHDCTQALALGGLRQRAADDPKPIAAIGEGEGEGVGRGGGGGKGKQFPLVSQKVVSHSFKYTLEGVWKVCPLCFLALP